MAALASNGSSLHSLPQYWSIDTTCLGRQLLGIDERARRALRTTNSHPDYPKPFERHWLNTRNRSIDGISWCADSYLVGDIKKTAHMRGFLLCARMYGIHLETYASFRRRLSPPNDCPKLAISPAKSGV
jgi:hypothetical protein